MTGQRALREPPQRWSRRLLGILSACCLVPLPDGLADAQTNWLRLDRLDRQQRTELQTRQRQYSSRVAPLPPAEQRQMELRLRQQQQHQRLSQDRQLRDSSALRQRQGVAPDFGSRNRGQVQLQRFRQQQQDLQNRLRHQRRSWPYGR